MKTLQEAFDTMARHLLTQKCRSEDLQGCRYRTGNLKCAVGALIADEHYYPGLERRSTHSELVMDKLALSDWDTSDAAVDLYSDMQSVHDNILPKYWRKELLAVARYYSLDASCLSTESLG